jgi:hypothetical protein
MANQGIFLPRPGNTTYICFGILWRIPVGPELRPLVRKKQDINARPMRVFACASGAVAQERDPEYGFFAGSHLPTPSLQPSPKVQKALITPPDPEGAEQL